MRQFVKTVEVLFPEGGHGSEKLEIVKGWLEESSRILGIADDTFKSVWPLINSSITILVKALK